MTSTLFEEITRWQKETFPHGSNVSKLKHLEEEIVELMEELKSTSPNPENIRNEYADCFILLFGSAHINGYEYDDIVNLIRDKFEIVKKRKWGKPDEHGVVKHIKEEKVDEEKALWDEFLTR